MSANFKSKVQSQSVEPKQRLKEIAEQQLAALNAGRYELVRGGNTYRLEVPGAHEPAPIGLGQLKPTREQAVAVARKRLIETLQLAVVEPATYRREDRVIIQCESVERAEEVHAHVMEWLGTRNGKEAP